jgi:hypothetical protein
MTQEEKQLLLRDLYARLPYGVEIQVKEWTTLDTELKIGHIQRLQNDDIELKPYLRPMSSMTEEEKEEYCNLQAKFLWSSQYPVTDAYELFDWLNIHHFDYRGLIEKGLAIEVTEENNPYKE